MFIARNRFAVLDKGSNQILVKNLRNEITKKCAAPCASTDAIFYAGTGTLLCRSDDKVGSRLKMFSEGSAAGNYAEATCGLRLAAVADQLSIWHQGSSAAHACLISTKWRTDQMLGHCCAAQMTRWAAPSSHERRQRCLVCLSPCLATGKLRAGFCALLHDFDSFSLYPGTSVAQAKAPGKGTRQQPILFCRRMTSCFAALSGPSWMLSPQPDVDVESLAPILQVVLFDVQQRSNIAELGTPFIKYVVWSADMSSVALLSKHAIIIANKKLGNSCTGEGRCQC